MIEFTCPKCKDQLVLDDQSTATHARCPKCEAVFVRPIANRGASPEDPESFTTTNIIVGIACVLLIGLVIWYVSKNAVEGWGALAVLYVSAGVALFLFPAYVGRELGRERILGPFVGFLLGILLGWLGVLILLLYPNLGARKKCPECAEKIKAEAFVCRYCGRKF